MAPSRRKIRSGFTLIEIMAGLLVIVVGVLGAIMYRYNSALDARKADLHMGATRMALLLLEEWKGMSGAPYDPTKIETDLSIIAMKGTAPNYTATISSVTGSVPSDYFIVMPQPPATVNLGGIDMKELKVAVYWSSRGTPGEDNFSGKVELIDWCR